MKVVDKYSQFNILSSHNLSADELHVLTLFYKPLIGNNSFCLYLSFVSLLERNNLESITLNHQDLYDMGELDEVSFINARVKLEAVGLLKSYYDGVNYTYMLKTPFNPKQFMTDGVLGQYLLEKIGEKSFNYLVNKFRVKNFDKSEFNDVTANFDDVFKTNLPNQPIRTDKTYILGKNTPKKITIINKEFSFDEFSVALGESFLSNITNINEFKRDILSFSYVFGYDEGDMVNLVKQSLNRAGNFDAKMLKKHAGSRFHARYDSRPALTSKDLREENTEVREMVEARPIDILMKFNPNPTDRDLDVMQKIYSEINLPHSVLNFMFNKALIDKSGFVQAFNFYKAIGDTWILNSINTPEKAYNYANHIKEAKPKRTRSSKNNYANNDKKAAGWVEEKVSNIEQGVEYL